MSEQLDNTLTAYKGPEFQQKLLWQLLVEPEYAERTIPILAVEYFDDPNIKRLFLIMLEYVKRYGKVPNLQNQSVIQAINEFKSPNNVIEEESLFAVIERVKLWNERILNQTLMHDGIVVQQATTEFIKQQEIRKWAEGVLAKVKTGEIRSKTFLPEFDEKMQKIALIGNTEDNGSDATEGLDKALMKEFRKTIPTGVGVIDTLTGGGLGKGEIGLILTPSGVGKTTLLTKIANTARAHDYNVCQIIFEDTEEQIKRKHVTIWTGIPLSELDERNDEALQKANDHIAHMNPGKLKVKKFSQENTTMTDIKDWILREQKKTGIKFDIIILDYLDCLESHKKVNDRNEAELQIVKSFEAMASDFDIPCWSAIQSNRSGFDAELVEAHQSGGNIKRVQKAHFFMSVAKTPDQKEASLASIRIIKARFAKDGQTFKDCIFNNDTMEIKITDERYVGTTYSVKKKYSEDVIAGKAESIESHSPGGLFNTLVSNAGGLTAEDELLRSAYIKSENIEEKKPIDTSQFVSPGISTREIDNNDGVNDGVSEGANEGANEEASDDKFILEDKPIEKSDGVNDGVSEGVNDGVEPELLNWSGETFTTATNETEVKFEDIKPKIEPEVRKSVHEMVSNVNKNPISKKKIDLSEAEKKLLIDPDEVSSDQKHVFDYLGKMRVNEEDIRLR
jgi:replicative DNA helicase